MFSGIVETTGEIVKISGTDSKHLIIKPKMTFDDVKVNDSVAVNGVCLTVTKVDDGKFYFTAIPETLRITNLDALQQGEQVNLERSMKADQRISGHIVQGHVDSTAVIKSIAEESEALLVEFSIDKSLLKYIVDKGYIVIDGMSITVIKALENSFTVSFIPHTQQITRVNQYQVGTVVNIEVDVLAKYAEKLGKNNDN